MQLHNTTLALTKGKGEDPWPGLQLKVKYGNNEGFTTIVYNEKMTAGLDPGYDVGQFSAGPDVEIYTALAAESTGVNFARQALPVDGCSSITVPVGIDSEKGGAVTFSASTVPLGNYKYFLEDRLLGTYTELSTNSYTVVLPEKTHGSSRFFIHTSENSLTGIGGQHEIPNLLSVRVWISYGNVIIEGAVGSIANAEMVDLQGRKIFETRLSEGNYNSFPVPSGAKGVYLVRISDGAKVVVKKVVVL
jgi:hypothetical protein